jgi:hypothetical protein
MARRQREEKENPHANFENFGGKSFGFDSVTEIHFSGTPPWHPR